MVCVLSVRLSWIGLVIRMRLVCGVMLVVGNMLRIGILCGFSYE